MLLKVSSYDNYSAFIFKRMWCGHSFSLLPLFLLLQLMCLNISYICVQAVSLVFTLLSWKDIFWLITILGQNLIIYKDKVSFLIILSLTNLMRVWTSYIGHIGKKGHQALKIIVLLLKLFCLSLTCLKLSLSNP